MSHGHITRLVVREQMLQHQLNDPAHSQIQCHGGGELQLEQVGHLDQLQLLVDLGHKLGRTGESKGANTNQTKVKRPVLPDTLSERSALVVDGNGRQLRSQLKQVHGRVENGGLELSVQISQVLSRLNLVNLGSDVDESDNVDGKLAQNRTHNVLVEDTGLGSFSRQLLNGLTSRNGDEADREQQTTDGSLRVGSLTSSKEQNGQSVGGNQTVKGENLVHLDSGNQSTSTLSNNVSDGRNVGQLGSEGSSNRGITQLESGGLVHILRRHANKLVSQSRGLSGSSSRLGLSSNHRSSRQNSNLSLGLLVKLNTSSLHGLEVVHVERSRRVQMGNGHGNRRILLAPLSHHLALLVVDVLQGVDSSVVGHLLHAVDSTVQKSNTNMGLLESTDIVGSVTAHESHVSEILHVRHKSLLLRGGNTSVNPGVSDEIGDRVVVERKSRESRTGDTNIVSSIEVLGIQRLGSINKVNLKLINSSESKLAVEQIQNVSLSAGVKNTNLLGNMDTSQRVISGDHDTSMGRLVEHLDGLLGIGLDGTREDEETGKNKFRLNVLSVNVNELILGELHVLGSKSKNTLTSSSVVLVSLVVSLGHGNQHLLDGLGGSLGSNVHSSGRVGGNGRGSLEGRRELESTSDIDRLLLGRRSDDVMSTNGPGDGSQGVLLHGVSNNLTLIEKDKSVSSSKHVGGLIRNSSSGLGGSNLHKLGLGSKASQTLNQKILLGKSTGLVETADIETASKGDSEGLGTVDVELGESGERRVDGHGQLHGELRRHNRGDNKHTVQQQFGSVSVDSNTLGPHVVGSGNGKLQQEENEEQSLGVTDTNMLGGKDHDSNKSTLGSLETGLGDNGNTSGIGRRRNVAVHVGLGSSDLQGLGSTGQDGVLVLALHIELGLALTQLDGLFEKRSGLSRQHGLVDNTGTGNENHITSQAGILTRSSNRDDVTGKQLVSLDLRPLSVSVHLNGVRSKTHASELGHSSLTLPHHSGLKHDKHDEGEDGVVPLLIETPESNTEDLEDKEGGNSVLKEELGKGGNGDIKLVGAVDTVGKLEIGGLDGLGGLEGAHSHVFVVNGEMGRSKGLGGGVPDVPSLLEDKGGLSGGIRVVDLSNNGNNSGSATVGGREELDEIGVLDVLDDNRLNGTLEVDVPVGTQPGEGVGGHDGAEEEEGPLLAGDPGVVLEDVRIGEDGVENEKRPNVEFDQGRQLRVERGAGNGG